MGCIDFSFKHYNQVLLNAFEQGYKFLRCDQWKSDLDKAIILRHDVDSHLENALKFAYLEKDLGVSATYFIRLHATYNPFFLPNCKIIEEIKNLGHEIGFHIDHLPEDRLDYVAESEFLAKFFNAKICSFTTHEPLKNPEIKGGCDFLGGMKYISDSSGRWREGCMCEWIGEANNLYINTHPTWWYEKTSLENF